MRRANSLAAVGLLALALSLCAFDWPHQQERLVRAITQAATPRERRDALRLLAERELPSDLAPIEACLRDADVEVRVDALALLASAPNAQTYLRTALEQGDARLRAAATKLLGGLHEDSVSPALRQALTDPEPTVRLAAARALAGHREPDSAAVLAAALDDRVLEVRVAAAEALGEQRSALARDALLRALADPLPELRAAAIGALSHWSEPVVVAALESSLADEDELVVLSAMRALRSLEVPLAEAQLQALARSPSARVASAAVESARSDADPPVAIRGPAPWLAPLERTAEVSLSQAASERVLDELERTLPASEALAGDALLEWLVRAPGPLRVRIARLIERSDAAIAGQPLVPLLALGEPRERAAVTRLLAQVRGGELDARLIALLDDRSALVREAASFALTRRLDGVRARQLATRSARPEGPGQRDSLRVLASALPRLRAPIDRATKRGLCSALTGLLHRDVEQASLALRALAAIDDGCARQPVLRRAERAAPSVRIAALRASLRDHTVEAGAVRRRALTSKDAAVVATAIVASALAGDAQPRSWLIAQIGRAAWPIGPAASFALAHAVARAPVDAARLCALTQANEPVSAHNAELLRATRGVRCALTALPHPLLRAHSTVASPAIEPAISFAPRALLLRDGYVLISSPDGSGSVDWPSLAIVGEASAWLGQ
jgi:HEAT repeat-containing taxis protein